MSHRTLTALALSAGLAATTMGSAFAADKPAATGISLATVELNPELHQGDIKLVGERESVLRPGEQLGVYQVLQSDNKDFGFYVDADGTVKLLQWTSAATGRTLWTSQINTIGAMSFGANGKLYFHNLQGQRKWQTDNETAKPGQETFLKIADNGAVYISIDGKIVWYLQGQNAPAPIPPQPGEPEVPGQPAPGEPEQPAPGEPEQPEAPETGDQVLKVGESLQRGQKIASKNDRYEVRFLATGNVVLVDTKKNDNVIWETGTTGQRSAGYFFVAADGNVVLTDARGRLFWQSGTAANNPKNPRFIVRNNGSVVIKHEQDIVWVNGVVPSEPGQPTPGEPEVPEVPEIPEVPGDDEPGAPGEDFGNVLKPGTELNRLDSLTSRNGKFSLEFTKAGVVQVVKKADNSPVWTAKLGSGNPDKLLVTKAGSMEVRGAKGKLLFTTSSDAAQAKNPRAVLRNDGVLEVRHGSDVVWSSAD